MLQIKNTYDDRTLSVLSRHVFTGRDGEAVSVEPGEAVEIEIDGDYQTVISSRAREPGELPQEVHPVAQVVDETDQAEKLAAPEPQLTDATDDQVRAEITDMIDTKTGLTSAGKPDTGALNERLRLKGLNPVNAAKRDELMPQAAATTA